MTQHKRKKTQKYRGSKTHGGGSMKKRRGAGHRGGRGRAGSGKRGDAKKPSFWKDDRLGESARGFYSHTRTEAVTLNVSDVEIRLDQLKQDGHASEKGGVWTVDLKAAGYDKLLGSGQLSTKLTITVPSASSSAISKIEDAGGSVTLTEEKKEKPKKTAKKKRPSSDEDDEDEDQD